MEEAAVWERNGGLARSLSEIRDHREVDCS